MVAVPVYLPSMLVAEEPKAPVSVDSLKDGVYNVESEEYEGYRDVLELTVTDGKIAGVVWDSVDAEGTGKRMLSEQGVYVMTEDGLTWKEQAEALAAAVISNQSVECLNLNEQGKTDAVSGVSIYVGGFVNVLTEALEQAAGIEKEDAEAGVEAEPAAPEQGTVVDGISGATISSKAVVNGVNRAVEFLNQM